MRVAILGMGRMGQALAVRLAGSGHDVTVWNRSPGKASDAVAAGAREQTDLAEAISGAEIVLSSLGSDEAVRSVVFDPGGVRESLGDGVYADTSTISPNLSHEIADQVPGYVAMPILGPPDGVRKGAAIYLLGGKAELIEKLQPLVESLTEDQRHFDTPELASSAKLVSNLLLLNSIISLAECVAAGESAGLSRQQMAELLRNSPMLGRGVANRLEAVLDRAGETMWTIDLGAKDGRLVTEMASAAGVELPLTAVAKKRYEDASSQGLGDEDIALISRLYGKA